MKNPFLDDNDHDEKYIEFVKGQVLDIAIGESKKVNTRQKPLLHFRMTLTKISSDLGIKFRTRADIDGNLWVKRIK